MKGFSKYIIQGIGLAIGIVIIFGSIIGFIKVKNNMEQIALDKQLEKTRIEQAEKQIERNKLIELGFSEDEATNAAENGIDIESEGEYVIEVISGSGDVVIYDMIPTKYIKTIVGVNRNKVSTFEGKQGYKVIPDKGLIIECVKK